MTIGQRIQKARKETGMSQREFGQKLGVSGSMIGQYENDLRNPKQETLQRMADVLGIDVNWLRTGQDDFSRTTSSARVMDEVYQMFSFLELSPENTQTFVRTCRMLQKVVIQLNSGIKNEEDVTIKICTDAFCQLIKSMQDLVPDGWSEIKNKYEAQKRRNLEYEEFLVKYKRLGAKNRREIEKFLDYLLFKQENNQ